MANDNDVPPVLAFERQAAKSLLWPWRSLRTPALTCVEAPYSRDPARPAFAKAPARPP
jgi:hypothetical protein